MNLLKERANARPGLQEETTMRTTISAAAVVAAFSLACVAGAQTSSIDAYPNNFTIRAGVALPIDKSLSNVANSFTNVGVEYNFNNSLVKGGDTYLSIDSFFKNFNNVTAYPIAINQRFYTGAHPLGRRSYYFIGLGITWSSISNPTYSAVSARGGLGMELGPNIIAELAGYVSDQAGGNSINAITINLGYRF